jgi:hypothetical protein
MARWIEKIFESMEISVNQEMSLLLPVIIHPGSGKIMLGIRISM